MLLVFRLVCTCLLSSVQGQLDNNTITLAAYGPFSSPWAAPMLAGLVLADLDLRKQIDPSVRSRFRQGAGITIPRLNPNLRVKLVIGDDAEKVTTGVKTVLGWVNGPQGKPMVNAILGGYSSEVAKPVASLCSTVEVVNLAFGGQSAELSNKDQYPYFFRVLPPDTVVGPVLWCYVKTLGWRSAVMLYSEEAFGQGVFNTLLGNAQLEGRGASISGVGLKAMTVNFDPEVARAAVRRVKLANSRLVFIVIGGNLEVNTRRVMREENLTSPGYQFMSAHTTVASLSRSEDYVDFGNWHAVYGLITYNNPLFSVMGTWPQMTPGDILNNTQHFGIDRWVKPLQAGLFTPALFQSLQRTQIAMVGLLYNAFWALILTFNRMLHDGYTPPEIQGPLLRSYLRNVSFEGIAQVTEFDQNQDGLANWVWQYVDNDPSKSAPSQPPSWVVFANYMAVEKVAVRVPTAPNGPRWVTGTFSWLAPQVLAGCPPGTYLDAAANAGAGACAPCPEGRISTAYDVLECSRCPAGTREVGRLTCEDCQPGTASTEGSSQCSPCEAGSATEKPRQSRCAQCGLGKYQGQTGQLSCESCAPGSVADVAGAVECQPCPRGHLQASAGGVECQRCPKSSYADRPGSSACEPCGAGTETEGSGSVSASECVCAAGMYLLPDLSGCAMCPEGMECKLGSRADTLFALVAGGGAAATEYPKTLPGYWTASSDPLSVFRCKSAKHCPGPNPETCGPGLIDRSCSICDDRLFWDGKECAVCPTPETSKWLFPGVPLFLCPIGLLLFYKLFGDGVEKWGSWQNGFSALAFVLLNHHQIIELVKNVGADLPSRELFSSFGFSVDLLGVFKMACAGFGGFESGLVIRISAPALLVAVCVLTFATLRVLAVVLKKPVLRLDWNRTCNVFMSMIFTFFTAISALSLSLFKCSLNPNKKRSLIADLSIICYEDARWMRMLALAIVAVIIYCVGVGGLFFRTVMVAPSRFQTQGFSVRWKFLFIRYRPDVYWWSLTFLCKNLLLNLSSVVYQLALSQLYHNMGVMMAYMLLVCIFTPYRHRVVNLTEVIISIVLVFYMAIMSLFVDPGSGQDQVGIAAAYVIFLPLAWAPFAAIHLLNAKFFPGRDLQQKAKCERVVREVADAICLLNAEELSDFLQGLSEWDYFAVLNVCDVFCSELLEKDAARKRWRNTSKNYTQSLQRSKDTIRSGSEQASAEPKICFV